jgi:hypothetical protein
MSTSSAPEPEESPIPDEVWDRFLNDTERDIRASAPKEPSARARVVARRLREMDARTAEDFPRRPRRSGREPSDRPWRPAAARAGRREAGPRAGGRRSGWVRSAVTIVAVVAVVLFVLAPQHLWDLITGN